MAPPFCYHTLSQLTVISVGYEALIRMARLAPDLGVLALNNAAFSSEALYPLGSVIEDALSSHLSLTHGNVLQVRVYITLRGSVMRFLQW